ncbi:hypothetical protein HDU80_007569 [Chytriomyces hyalinus]|nr:hypothetical protein HDU80_007569 [Chytriomyces hyalinus]
MGVTAWVKRQYLGSEAAQKMGDFVNEYGPAWVVSVQVVGWVCWAILLVILIVLDVHPTVIADYFQLSPSMRSMLDKYGLPAAAYLLNRVIFPLRLLLEIGLVKLIHVPVNKVLRPWWDWSWGKVGGWIGWDVAGEKVCESEEAYSEEDGRECLTSQANNVSIHADSDNEDEWAADWDDEESK